jgi:hypothetical protein
MNLKDKFRALKIPYGIPTVGQLPNQLPKATYQRPRTKSATKGHAPNPLPKATYQASYPKGDSVGLSQVGPRKEAPATIQGKPRPYVFLGGP